MNKIDQHGKLEGEPFSFQATKDKKIFIYWHGRQVTIVKGAAANKFLEEIEPADPAQAQLLMARVTGHFKHGNER